MATDQGTYDLIVIGGGINGAGIACDATGRGLRVLLAEQNDLASATSSASSKLVHGGLRYLEQYQFRLVREALSEREVLLGKAPHIIWPLRFVLPHRAHMRPAWMLRLGLFLYDNLGSRTTLPKSIAINLHSDDVGAVLANDIRKGFAYYDCWVDDARLVVLNAVQAATKGATILTRHKLTEAHRTNGLWQVQIQDQLSGALITAQARAVVNAAGPWVESVLHDVLQLRGRRRVRLVKGSHIIVPRMHDGLDAFILQHDDGRVVFVLPYEDAFSLIGTTDVAFDGDPAEVAIVSAEIDYLIGVVQQYFQSDIAANDIVSSYAGVRPLYDDDAKNPSAVTRDYVLEVDTDDGAAPLLSVFGGKVTTYRRLAEQALDRLTPYFPDMGLAWTATSALPGGDLGGAGFDSFLDELTVAYSEIDQILLRGLARRHGSNVPNILGAARRMSELGADFGGGLWQREVDYLCAREWAMTAADILWRRTKCGLHMSAEERSALAAYLNAKIPPKSVAAV